MTFGKQRSHRSPRNAAMDLLARREHSALELRRKLLARGFESDEIETAVADLAGEGLISDERFAEAFVSARVRKGQGPLRIRQELEQRGVGAELILNYLERSDVDWCALARSVRDKKFGAVAVAEYRDWAKQARFLQYRGFTGEQISAALAADKE